MPSTENTDHTVRGKDDRRRVSRKHGERPPEGRGRRGRRRGRKPRILHGMKRWGGRGRKGKWRKTGPRRRRSAVEVRTTTVPYSIQCRKFRVPTTEDTPLPLRSGGHATENDGASRSTRAAAHKRRNPFGSRERRDFREILPYRGEGLNQLRLAPSSHPLSRKANPGDGS